MAKRNAIKKIAVRGFKSICDRQEVEIRPLTLLAGANSSGKSSLMQPLLLLKQTLEAQSDPGALLLHGPNVRFTQAEQLLSRSGKERAIDFSVGITQSDGNSLEVTFKHEKSIGFSVVSTDYARAKEHLPITPGMSHEEFLQILPLQDREVYDLISKGYKKKPQWHVVRNRCFLNPVLDILTNEGTRFQFSPRGITLDSADFIPHLQRLIHLPGLRGNPQRTYPKSAGSPLFPGTFENYAASVIGQWQENPGSRMKQLGTALEDMGLTWKVEVKAVDDTQVELRVGRLVHGKRGGARDLVSIADVGFGVSQSLPVVVALIAAEPGQLVYLEQPEIHLHPLAQRKLAHVIKRAAEKGVTAIVETHSALLLKEIQTLVAKGELDKNIVKLHWFQRQPDGRTIITSADLDENGAFGPWPEDFDEVELDAEKDYLDAVENREVRA
jgi:hypothetical protein